MSVSPEESNPQNFRAELDEPEYERVEEHRAYRATAGERAFAIFACLLVAAIIASIIGYAFQKQAFRHQEQVQKTCLENGGAWVHGECQYDPYNPDKG